MTRIPPLARDLLMALGAVFGISQIVNGEGTSSHRAPLLVPRKNLDRPARLIHQGDQNEAKPVFHCRNL